MLSCWPALSGWLGFWWACPGLWQSVQTLACRCVPSPSSPAWAGATPQDSPSEREDGSPRLLLWSPAGERGQNIKFCDQYNRGERNVQENSLSQFRAELIQEKVSHCKWGAMCVLTHILVGHLPVGSLSIWNHLPHDDSVTPHIAGWGELPVGYGLWSRPSDGDLPSGGKIRPCGLLKQGTWKVSDCFIWREKLFTFFFSKKFYSLIEACEKSINVFFQQAVDV